MHNSRGKKHSPTKEPIHAKGRGSGERHRTEQLRHAKGEPVRQDRLSFSLRHRFVSLCPHVRSRPHGRCRGENRAQARDGLQNRSDRQLRPPSILRNSEVSTTSVRYPSPCTAERTVGYPSGTMTVSLTQMQLAP